MTYKEVNTMLASVGIPYAYNQFNENTPQVPPFICFLYTNSNDFVADGKNYSKIRTLSIELYTDNKDFALEDRVERILTASGLVYTRSEAYIDTEKMFMVTFTTEIVIGE